ncbi:MAG: hypothetical protein COU47_02505 [Candidatus Niyogibacteria bacterium CG10_big_fil_rev_8_21_14_0_10_46_36]|uniref:Uncharacterized protein n=1 Tax=Candidatus Niyogibacteria bacterium CG10_big_fil_rev_8_21_14_0_10_46_36 TaxID=1974726 RepID=A0A2H0TF74_9BACT|nr:MAG: hypothetical protein COU47_02505 [Candidatus Niyogibacteria bacterium CG10_big_fil_rev_8_21_14_0_10_46_36]
MNIAIIAHSIILIGMFGFIGLLLHYKQEYSFEKRRKQSTVLAFGIIITILMVLSTIALFQVPWSAFLS